MRISDWSSDVCSSDLPGDFAAAILAQLGHRPLHPGLATPDAVPDPNPPAQPAQHQRHAGAPAEGPRALAAAGGVLGRDHVPEGLPGRSEEHTSELQSLMRISYAVFCLKKNTRLNTIKQLSSLNTKYTHT